MNKHSKTLPLVMAALVITVCYLLPGNSILSKSAMSALGVFLGALILWITEALPMSVTTMLMICVLSFERIIPFQDSVSSISTGTSLFIMASSGITVAVSSGSLPRMMTNILLRRFARHPWLLVFGIGYLVALTSSLMSSLATCALFTCIIDVAISREDQRMRRCLMLLIPACAGIGGFMSPAGTPANILLMDLLVQNGSPVTFVSWCSIGYPLGLIAVFLFTLSAVITLRPAFHATDIQGQAPVTLTRQDTLTVIILTLTVVGWLASSWISQLDICMVAVLSMTVMFLPHVGLLKWDTFSKEVNWDLVITMGTVSVLMTGISKAGLFDSLVGRLSGLLSQLPVFWMLVCVSVFVCAIRTFIPTTTAVVALLGPVLVGIAQSAHIPAGILLYVLAFWTASALLLVYTEPIYLISWHKRDYSAMDLFKAGIVPVALLTLVLALILPLYLPV